MRSIVPPAAAVIVACVVPTLALAEPARRPNVVVIVSDDAGYADFSMHGGFPTPRIDSIAAEGVRFTDAYVSGCVCSPTRAGLLTGRYQQRFGHETNIPPVPSERNGLPLTETTFADRMRAGGYRTAAIGKWHLGYTPAFHPLSRGFDEFYGFLKGSRSYVPLPTPTPLDAVMRGRDQVPESFSYLTDDLAREAADTIAAHRDHPFFLYVAFNAVHAPNQTLPADLERGRTLAPRRAEVAAMTVALDRAVGRILDALAATGLADDTLVVFVNDNGGPPGHDNGSLRGRKGTMWEGGIRVPCAMRWPAQLPRGHVVSEPVIALDILPTALAAAGIEYEPADLDGVDLLPFLTGATATAPHEVLHWRQGSRWAVRAGSLKLVKADDGRPELFDLAVDRGESHDLTEAQPADLERLRALHDAWSREMAAPLVWDGQDRPGKPRRQAAKSAVN
ncbi:MAG: sulfatase-like hydrolase/transferase [Planctomycetaceae bacterium]